MLFVPSEVTVMDLQLTGLKLQMNCGETVRFCCSMKISQTTDKLADQHAYVLRLRHSGGDGELLAQERLVEKQLKRTKVGWRGLCSLLVA